MKTACNLINRHFVHIKKQSLCGIKVNAVMWRIKQISLPVGAGSDGSFSLTGAG